jgi:hypothetical protein
MALATLFYKKLMAKAIINPIFLYFPALKDRAIQNQWPFTILHLK